MIEGEVARDEQVIWTTPMFGLTRYGRVLRENEDGTIRTEFGNDGMEIRDLPREQLRRDEG